MTAVAQGTPGKEIVPDECVPPPIVWLGQSELGHVALLLQKAGSWLRAHSKEEAHEIASIADSDYRVPADSPAHPEVLELEWITEPGLRIAVDILGRSLAEPFVIRRGSYFLMIRRRFP